MKNIKNYKNKEGFTLIELLVVVTIVGVLASISFAAYGSIIRSGQYTKAKSMCSNLVSGLESFRIDYGRHLDIGTGTTSSDSASGTDTQYVTNDADFVKNLLADSSASSYINTRNQVYLEVNPAEADIADGLTSSYTILDPWGFAYAVLLDTSYNNRVPTPTLSAHPGGTITAIQTGTPDIFSKIIAWSFGDDTGTFKAATTWK